MPLWFVLALLALSLPQVVAIATAGRTMPPALHRLYDLSARLAMLLFGRT